MFWIRTLHRLYVYMYTMYLQGSLEDHARVRVLVKEMTLLEDKRGRSFAVHWLEVGILAPLSVKILDFGAPG